MVEQLCPTCGCSIVEGHEKEGVTYCCVPCATREQCECGCCETLEEGADD